MDHAQDITRLLQSLSDDPDAEARLYELIYSEMRSLAGSQLKSERAEHTLQPTALANEAFLKLSAQSQVDWSNRNHFFAIAARAMRRILVDHARAKGRAKRGGDVPHVPLTLGVDAPELPQDTNLVALDEVLTRLKEHDPAKAQVVELRYFGGLSNREIAEVLGVTTRTVERHWNYSKAWLYRALKDD